MMVYCGILYNMILEGKDSNIDIFTFQLKLETNVKFAHFSGQRVVIKHFNNVKHVTTINIDT
jgi:hypothetical protein